MKTRLSLTLLCVLAVVLLLAKPEAAWSGSIVLFDSISGGYQANTGYRITGMYGNGQPDLTQGVMFSPVASGFLDESRLVIFTEIGTSAFRLLLFEDDAGAIGAPIADVIASGDFDSHWPGAFTVSTKWPSAPFLKTGTTYWLIGAPPESQFANLGWVFSSQPGNVPSALRWDSGGWEYSSNSPIPAFALIDEVTPVPDPGSTLLLLGIGLAGLRASRRWWH